MATSSKVRRSVKITLIRTSSKQKQQYVKNRMFQTNQAKLLERLEKKNRSNNIRSRRQEIVRFWSGTWDQPVKKNDEAKLLKKVERQLREKTKQ